MLRKVTFIAVICGILAQPAAADSIQVTGGTFSESTGSVADFSITAPSFLLTGTATDSSGLLQQCVTCEPGSTFSLRGWWEFEGEMQLDGATTAVTGRLKFNSGRVRIPDLAENEGAELTRAFAFVGKVTPVDGGKTLNLHGGGTALINFFRHEGEGVLPNRLRYDFEAVQQTPEPATLALVGSGLAGAAFARRRRKPR